MSHSDPNLKIEIFVLIEKVWL